MALMTLNRPETLNALNAALREDISNAVSEAREDDEIRALVITGAGRGFCSGAAPGLRSSKRVLQRNWECDLEQALRNETVGLSQARNAPHDMKESRLSWGEKRPPVFTGQ